MMRILFVDDQQRELDGMTRMLNWAEMGAEVAGAVTDGAGNCEDAADRRGDLGRHHAEHGRIDAGARAEGLPPADQDHLHQRL